MELSYFNIQKFCIHDGPGIRTTVFLKGCPLKCRWCHNPEARLAEPQLMFFKERCTSCGRCVGFCDARKIDESGRLFFDRSLCTLCGKCVEKCFNFANEIVGKTASCDEILAEVLKDKHFYDSSGGGMTISGGEPSAQPAAVLELIEKAKEKGINSAIETCGSGSVDFYKKANELGSIFLYDIKGIDPEKHLQNTGVTTDRIHKNLKYLLESNAKVIIRMPLIPTMNDSDDDLELLKEFLSNIKDKILYAEIMPYHNLGVEKSRRLGKTQIDDIPNGKPFAKQWQEILSKSGAIVKISGE